MLLQPVMGVVIACKSLSGIAQRCYMGNVKLARQWHAANCQLCNRLGLLMLSLPLSTTAAAGISSRWQQQLSASAGLHMLMAGLGGQ